MPNTMQRGISRNRLGAASATLTFVVVLGLGIVTTPLAQAQTFTVLYNFTGGTDGGTPYAGLLGDDRKGNLLGTTYQGGAYGYGVVFKLDKSGKLTVLHSFTGGADGGYPYAGLIRSGNGNLYGTTYQGGSSNAGTVFKVSKQGTETVLHNFAGGAKDGCNPAGALLEEGLYGNKGTLYGTTYGCGAYGYGVVFKLTPWGKLTVLHSFAGATTDGAYPMFTGLFRDHHVKANFYGVTEEGGASGYGVLYKLSERGKWTVLHSFAGGTTDGCYPVGTPAVNEAGFLFGTTEGCGASGYGIVWTVGSVLYNFTGGPTDGAYPQTGVILSRSLPLYGDTEEGGAFGLGTLYRLNKKGVLTVLHSFAGSDGEYPLGVLLRDRTGNLYGTTSAGGTYGYGTVWKLTK